MNNLRNHIVRCDTIPERQPGKTDHYLIMMLIELPQAQVTPKPSLELQGNRLGGIQHLPRCQTPKNSYPNGNLR
jgi:hypothetical protein